MVVNRRLRTELRREIRRSFPRFLSIVVMVALGVLFLVGLRSAAPDMRRTADGYFDGVGMYDIQILTTLGLTPADVDAFAAADGVEAAEGGQFADALLLHRETQKTVKLINRSETMNVSRAVEGRLPEAANECALDDKLRHSIQLEIGDVVRFQCAPGMEGLLTAEEFTVTGFVQSPLFISLDRGNGSLGDGSIAGFVLLPEASFDPGLYTTVYLRLDGAAALNAYEPAYETLTAARTDALETLADARAELRYATLRDEGQAQIDDAWEQLAQGRKDGEAELADAEAQLADARAQLDDGWAQLEQGRLDFDAAAREGQAQLDAARAQLDDGKAQLAAGRAELEAAQATLEQTKQDAPAQFAAAQAEIDAGWETVRAKEPELTAARAQLDEAAKKIEGYALLLEILGDNPGSPVSAAELQQLQAQLAQGEAAYAAGLAELNNAKAQLTAAQQQIDAQIAGFPAQLAAAQAQIDAGRATLAEKEAQLAQGERDWRTAQRDYQQQLADAQQQLADAEAELKQGEQDYLDGLAKLDEGRSELERRLAEGAEEIRAAERQLARLERAEVYVLDRDSSNYGFVSYSQNAERMAKLSQFFPVIFFLVAALVCLTTMTRMVEEERTQIGAIKALGYGTRAIAGKYLAYGVLAALLGAIPGCIIGSYLIPWVIYSSYLILYNMPPLQMAVDWPLCLISSAAGIGCTVLATLFAALSTVRQTPAALMRPKAPKPGKRILLEHIKPLWKRLRFSVKVSARNLFRFKKRFWMTVIGVAGCTALLIAGFGLRRSIFDILDVQMGEIYHFDLQLSFDPDEPGAADAVRQALTGDSEVAAYAEANTRSASFRAHDCSMNGFLIVTDKPAALAERIDLHTMAGQPLTLTDGGAVIDQKLAEELSLQIGDTLTVDDGRRYDVTVAGINEQYVYHYVYLTAAVYGAATGEAYRTNACYVSADDRSDGAIAALSERLLRIEGVSAVNNTTAMARSFRQTLQGVDSAIMVIISSAAALALVVLYNLTNINVTERVRELATIKVLGFYDLEVGMYIYRENAVLTLFGIALGQLLGRVLCRWLVGTIEIDIVMFGRRIGWQTHLWSVVMTLVFAALVNLLMFFRMKKIDMVQSLKSVE